MRRIIAIIAFIASCRVLLAQEWTTLIPEIDDGSIAEFISVDDGDFALGFGYVHGFETPDGIVVKVAKDGSYLSRIVHLPEMMLQYHAGVQLKNGNYMVFGSCDDSLGIYYRKKNLRIDIFDDRLESISSINYCVDDDNFDNLSSSIDEMIMKPIVSKQNTIILAAALQYFVEQYGYYGSAIRFYEFDETGNIMRMIDNPIEIAVANSVYRIIYEPNSSNFQVTIGGGSFPPHAGMPGIYVVDDSLRIVAKQDLFHLQGGPVPQSDYINTITCDGNWIDGEFMIFDIDKYLHRRESFTYHTLYKLDSALNVHAELRLPPYDSCTFAPSGTNTAYVNDSTIFAFTYCKEKMLSFNTEQANVLLVDKDLNLLGRKAFSDEDIFHFWCSPTVFNDGSCVVPMCSKNGLYYPGNQFFEVQLMKFRREDIEITWDVIQENKLSPSSSYPNPATNIINIPIDETLSDYARIQIFDAKGMKCLDSEVGDSGNLIKLDIRNLDAGLYVYKLTSNSQMLSSGKFIKE